VTEFSLKKTISSAIGEACSEHKDRVDDAKILRNVISNLFEQAAEGDADDEFVNTQINQLEPHVLESDG